MNRLGLLAFVFCVMCLTNPVFATPPGGCQNHCDEGDTVTSSSNADASALGVGIGYGEGGDAAAYSSSGAGVFGSGNSSSNSGVYGSGNSTNKNETNVGNGFGNFSPNASANQSQVGVNALDSDISNRNSNIQGQSLDNDNVNVNKNGQGQEQGQNQGQGQVAVGKVTLDSHDVWEAADIPVQRAASLPTGFCTGPGMSGQTSYVGLSATSRDRICARLALFHAYMDAEQGVQPLRTMIAASHPNKAIPQLKIADDTVRELAKHLHANALHQLEVIETELDRDDTPVRGFFVRVFGSLPVLSFFAPR